MLLFFENTKRIIFKNYLIQYFNKICFYLIFDKFINIPFEKIDKIIDLSDDKHNF